MLSFLKILLSWDVDVFVVNVRIDFILLFIIVHSSFGNDVQCNMGNETGGYCIRLDGDIKYTDLKLVIENKIPITNNNLFFDYSILGPNVLIENCSLLDSVIICEHAHILASYMKNCSVLSSSTYPTLYTFFNVLK